MSVGYSSCSTSSDFRDNFDYYTRIDYWSEYNFEELVADTQCTTYSNRDQALEIFEAFEQAAEREDIEISHYYSFRNRLTFNYKNKTSKREHAYIRFRPSTTNVTPTPPPPDFVELIADTKGAVYCSIDNARKALDACAIAAEQENIELSPTATFRNKLTFNYRFDKDLPWTHVSLRFISNQLSL